MDAVDFFRAFLLDKITALGHGSQKQIAAKAGIEPRYLNDFLKKRKNISENLREKIANSFDLNYLECLERGRALINEKKFRVEQMDPEHIILDYQKRLDKADAKLEFTENELRECRFELEKAKDQILKLKGGGPFMKEKKQSLKDRG